LLGACVLALAADARAYTISDFTQVASFSGAQIYGLTSDPSGNVYAGNNSNSTAGPSVQKFAAGGSSFTDFGPGVGDADGIAYGGGYIFTGDKAGNGLRRTLVSDPTQTSILVSGAATSDGGSPVVYRGSDG